jgi:hypothetical protein
MLYWLFKKLYGERFRAELQAAGYRSEVVIDFKVGDIDIPAISSAIRDHWDRNPSARPAH